MDEFQTARELIEQLHEAGISLVLDDFGTGFSSLSYLSQLPFSVLKIDRSFVQAMESDSRSENLVRSIIDMAKALEISVIAEGVETESQRERLRRLDCQAVQGYLMGRPMPMEEAAEWLDRD